MPNKELRTCEQANSKLLNHKGSPKTTDLNWGTGFLRSSATLSYSHIANHPDCESSNITLSKGSNQYYELCMPDNKQPLQIWKHMFLKGQWQNSCSITGKGKGWKLNSAKEVSSHSQDTALAQWEYIEINSRRTQQLYKGPVRWVYMV